MAEDSGEVIGGVQIQVGADLSSLDAAFDAAIARAVQDGQSLSDAISAAVKAPDFSAITGAADQVEARWQQLAQEMASALGIELPAPDISAITGAMAQVEQVAQQASQQLSLFAESGDISFSDATGQLNLFASEIEVVSQDALSATEAVTPLGAAAQSAGEGIAGLGSAAQTAGEEVSGASASFGSLVEQLAGLAVLNQIKGDLEAVGAAIAEATDNFTRADIALTRITGDSEEAATILMGLEQLGMSDGLSMPSLQSAAVRLQQMLPAGADVVSILGKIADGAAVMGTSIDAAATKFFTLVESGNASIKALAQIGINFESLAAGINAVNPALDATAESAKGLFKALDDQGRMAALQAALQGLAGTAQEVAEKTFGGMWNSLVAQWDQLMESAGEALIPLAKALKDFVSIDVIPFLQRLVDAFKSMPEPLQDAALAIGAIAVAIVPLGAALGGAALAVQSLGVAFEAASALFIEADGALAGIGAAAIAAAPEIALVGAALLALDLTGVISGVEEFGSAVKNVIGTLGPEVWEPLQVSIDAVKQATIDAVEATSGWKIVGPIIDELSGKFIGFASLLDEVSQGAKQGAENFSGWDFVVPGLVHVGDALHQAANYLNIFAASQGDVIGGLQRMQEAFERLSGATSNANTSWAGFLDATQSVLTSQATLKSRVDDARSAVEEISQALATGATNASGYKVTSQDLAAAQVALTAAQNSLNSSLGITSDKQSQIIQLQQASKQFTDQQTQSINALGGAARDAAAFMDSLASKVSLMQTELDHAQQNLNNAVQRLQDLRTASDGSVSSLGNIEIAENNVAKASQNLTAVQQNLIRAQQELDREWDVAGEAVAAFKQALFESIETADESKAALQELGIDIGNLGAHAPDMSALNKAIIDLGVNAKSVKPDIEQLTTDIANLAKDPGTSWDQMTVAIGNFDKAIAQVAKTDLPAAVQAYGQLVAILQESDAPFELVQTAAQNYQKSIDALAKQSLPAAIAAEQDLISKLQQQPGAYSQIISAQTDLLNKEILWAHETGQDASDYLIALAKIKDKLSGSGSDSVYQAYVDLQKVNADTFKQLDDAFANLIISGGKFGDAMVKVGQAIAKEMVEDVLKLALMPVQNALKELVNSLFPAATNAAQITTEGIKGLADASKAAADAANKAASAADNAAKAFDGGTGSGGLAGSIANLATVIGAVAGIIGAIAGVVSAVELAHIESDTGKIEVSTRGALSELINARKDAWDQHNATYDRLGELKNDLDSMKDSLLQLVQLGPGGGVGSSANADLDTIAGTIGTLLAATRDINSSVQALNQTTSPRLDNILGALQVISNDLFQINTSIRELGGSFEQSSQDMAQQIMQGTQSASANARAIAQSVGALEMPIRGVGNITADTITAAANAANANAAKSLAADLTSEEQLKVLGDEYAFYQRLIDQALRTGNLDLATQYQSAAQAIGRQIATLQEGISHSMQHTDEVYVAGAQNMTAAVGAAGQLITLSVDRSSGAITTSLNNVASTIGSIVAGALGSTGAGGGGGGGTITHPVVPSSGAGTGLSTGPYTGPPVTTYNSGTGVTQAGPAPVTHPVVPVYSPTVSGTLGSGNTAPMPHGTAGYATGGYVPEDQVAQVHAGEYVLNPVQVDKLLDAISSGPLTAGGITNPNINPAYEAPAQDQTAMAAAVAAQAAEASARMSEQLQLLNQQLSAAIVNAGPNSVQAQELRIQIEALKKQAASTGADTVAAQQKAADQITQALNEIPAAIEISVAASAGPRSLGPPSASGQDGRMASVPMTSISASIQPGGGQTAGQSAQQRALQAAMDWLDKQQGLSDADKAVAQATYASDAANGSLPVRSFGMGGAVTSDMLARLHAGEEVLPPDLAGALRRMVSTPQMGSLSPVAAGVTNSAIQNFTFNVYGPNTEQIVRQIASYVKQVTPAGAVGSTARSH